METVQTLTWSDAWYLAPELVLVGFALALAALDLLLPDRVNRDWIGAGTVLGLAAAAAFVCWHLYDFHQAAAAGGEGTHSLLNGSLRLDDFGHLLKLSFLGASALIVLASLGTVRPKDFPIKGEFYYLVLPAVAGAMVMASSADLMTLFIGLELLGIASYVLVGARKSSGLASEAAFKYVVTGGTASAFILYGMSFLYGVTGSTRLDEIARGLERGAGDFRALVYVAFFLLVAGFAVKLALAPFHAWAPDVYQGAPTPVTAFLAVVAKGAALAMVYRIFMNTAYFAAGSDPHLTGDVFLALAALAAAAAIAGTVGALRQQNAKRLLALSGVANAGMLLVPLALDKTDLHASFFAEFLFYLIAYALMNIGAFAVLTVVSKSSEKEDLSAFAGLYHRAPRTAVAMTVLLCSLAGLPVTGGFAGKLFILFGAVRTGAYGLAAIIVATTAVAYYVYFKIIRQMYMRPGEEEPAVRLPVPAGFVIWLCAAGTVALGAFPGPLLGLIDRLFEVGTDLLAG